MKKTLFIGCGTALVTPFTQDNKINFEELKKLLYERVKEIHVTRFPYNDFLFQKYDEEENI